MARIITHPGYLEALDEIKSMGAWSLARVAGVADPDDLASPGAEFLKDLRDDLVQRLDYEDDPLVWLAHEDASYDYCALRSDEMAGEIVSTYRRWQVFVDLCAYDTDIEDYVGQEVMDLNALRDVALAVTGAQVLRALVDHIRTVIRDNTEDDPLGMFTVTSEDGVLHAVCNDDGYFLGARDMDELQNLADDHIQASHP